MDLLMLFIVANIINVILATIKTIVTVKSNKYVAALISAINYSFNVYIVVLTVCELPLWEKCLVVGLCNLFGVFVVKLIEEKSRKDRLWKIEFTINNVRFDVDEIIDELEIRCVPHRYIDLGMHTMFSCYCETGKQSDIVKDIIKRYDGKYFVTEGIQ